MKRFLILSMVLGPVAGSVATAEAKTEISESESLAGSGETALAKLVASGPSERN